MNDIYILKGSLQHYQWGGGHYLPALLGFPEQTNQHYAEWWLGAHPSSPSMLEIDGNWQPLTAFLAENPTALGNDSRKKFGNQLPYLLKILDVEKPLSIQLHPTKQQAEAGFARENAAGIALNAPTRTYKDDNHKPEMMIALSDFWLLHGFKPKADIIAALNARPSLAALAEKLTVQDLHSFYADIMQASQAQLADWLHPIITHNNSAYAADRLTPDNPDYWVLYSMSAMDIRPDKLDPGLICFYLFNIVHTRPGEGIYQDAGIPHAYLRGQNIELMACSDNVIRGGLTPKHVDIAQLLQVVDCREVAPKIIPAAPHDRAQFTYSTPAQDFALTHLRYAAADRLHGQAHSAEIVLVMQGAVKIASTHSTLTLTQGESAFICADTHYVIDAVRAGYAVVAKLP
ncbi:mannose-6-phosphate isomerase, class I [Necropsobacter massiliensis]|uniref:mannose-6-phosphate isomerase, class I n=1 Tax=Necropsobacter massiliensis TaxID=1400001 RepID=UPI000595AB0B|nr:mannose-6-phosphate isomerase, class I [Necropsobacter massiliensis]